MNNYIGIQRIVVTKNTENEENILVVKPRQTPFMLERCTNELPRDCAVIRKGGYMLLDFGKEIHGGVEFCVQDSAEDNAMLKLTFGESVMEALSRIGEKNSGNHHSIREYSVPAIRLSNQKVGDTGFRFLKIEAINGDICLYNVVAVTNIRDIEYKGHFECNDEKLNEIWRTGAYTVQLNMHDYIWDGIKRDRLVWIGDMHPEVSTARMVFGKDDSIMRSLDYIRDETPADSWMNNTVTYSMWWIIIHYDLYMQYGDVEYLKEQKDYLEELIERLIRWINEGVVTKGMEGFVDWSSAGSESESEGRQSIICIGLERASRIFKILGEKPLSERCMEYVDRLQNEKIEKKANKSMSALTILSGRDSQLAKEVLEGNSAEEMSCFMGYYVLKAKAMLGEYQDALDIIRSFWGAMLDKGATTFWEDFDISWVKDSGRIDEITPEGKKDIHGDFGKHCYKGFRHSLCHGWASGPTPFLMDEIGGIEILEPGCKKLRISPKLCDLKWIRVEYPTPYGIVKVSATNNDGNISFSVDAPQEIEIVS